MKRFIQRFGQKVIGVLSGFDRLVFRGTLRQLAFVAGLKSFLWYRQVLLKDFGAFAEGLTEQLLEASLDEARRLGRPIQYLASSQTNKEALARQIAERDGITEGLIAVLECVEPFRGFEVYRNRDLKKLQLVRRIRKCKTLYHYRIDPVFGFMNARIQTWLPFNIQICINGREWLARQMDQAHLAYERRDNCFPWIEDPLKAQRLMEHQRQTSWPRQLNRLARMLNPAHRRMLQTSGLGYYWSVHQSEWATDLMFESPAALAAIYPQLVRHGMMHFGSGDVMRFLGGKVHGRFQGQIVSDFKDRPEGVRLKHRVGQNSVKLYDKQGSVLRVETTVHDAAGIKVFRPKEGDGRGKRSYRALRKGIADLHRRTQVSQASNERYLDALAAADTQAPVQQIVREVCRPVKRKGRRLRALQPWSPQDYQLLGAVNRGEFCLNGIRNRDLQALLFKQPAKTPLEKRRRSAHVSRRLRLLRAHGLLRKLPRSHRYKVTQKGRQIITAIIATQTVTLQQLNKAAA